MRLVAWNCNMALHRKVDAVLALQPDIAVISECAEPARLRRLSKADWIEGEPVWIGENETKGLAVFAFNGYRAALAPDFSKHLRFIAPVTIDGPARFNLLAVWAQNASGGVTRKRQSGPLRRALTRYREFLSNAPAVVAGDLNSNAIWDKPGWRINHMTLVDALGRLGLTSTYHAVTGEAHGQESVPTIYWRDRTQDGPTYHIDYVFVPQTWLDAVNGFRVGGFEEWCGTRLSDHVPIIVDVDL